MPFTHINLLDELAKPELAELRAVFQERAYVKGQVIFTPEEEADLAFIIARGRVRVYLAYEDKEFTLGLLGPGDLYTTHSGCYIQAFDGASLLLTEIRSVTRLMAEVPLFNRTMVRVLGRILQNCFSIIGGLAFKDLNNRLLDFLLREAVATGTPLGCGLELSLEMTMEQLAQLLGATRQTVSTLMNNLIRDGLLEKRGRMTFFIPDLEKLRAQTGS